MSSGYMRKLNLSSVATAPLPRTIHAGHPFKSGGSHFKLLNFAMSRVERGAEMRDRRIGRYVEADKQIYGWLVLKKDDKRRKKEKDSTGHPYAVEQHVPLTFLHLQDKMSYFSGVFAPTNGMFQHVGDAKEQKTGAAVLKIMNQQAAHAGYYRELMRAVLDLQKYQIGGLIVEWNQEAGYDIRRTPTDTEIVPNIVWQGNRTKAIDLYNAFWQPGIAPQDVDLKSEYFATVELTNYHEVQRKGASGEWFNVDEILQNENRELRQLRPSAGKTSFFKSAPSEMRIGEDTLASAGGQWSFMSETAVDSDGLAQQGIFELLNVWIWLNPYEQNLVAKSVQNKSQRNRLELWKLQILNGTWIVSAEQVTNAHARIPVAFGILNVDALGEWQRSTAEVMRPLQDFLSFMLNTHIHGVRKNIWGLTLYNKEIVDLSGISPDEVSAVIPAKPTGADMDLSRAIYRPGSTIDTRQTMNDFVSLLGVVQQLMPTQALPSQIAGIDRAVDRQVAAVVQGGNRPLQANARMVDESMLRKWRVLLFLNLVQFQDDVNLELDDGSTQQVNGEDLSKVSLQYIIGQGLKALDKQLVAQELQRMIAAIMSNQQASQEFDIVGLFDAWSTYLDVEIDLTQFRRQQSPQSAQPVPAALTDGTQI